MLVVRRYVLCLLLVLSGLAAGVGLTPSAQAATVGLTDPQTGRIVSDDPVGYTPHALNGTVYSIVQVGEWIVVGGSFTSVRSATNTTTITRNRVFAFDASTGAINPDFNPSPNGTVYKVQQSTDPGYVYVGGGFTSAAGATRRNLFKIRVSDGQVDTDFRPANIDGQVRDLEVVGNRLFVAGKFTHLGGNTQRALGTLNATSGAYDPYFTGVMAGWHRDHTRYPGDVTSVLSITTDPQNSQLVAGGNFTSVNGQARSQIAKFDISGASSYALSPWYTNLFTQACQANFETYLTDVEYSPNGAFFIVSTAGAYGGTTGSLAGTSGCDVVARFETGGTSGPTPATWTSYSGGDSTWTAEVTDNVVYVGGHQKFQNNPNGSNVANAGAVSRPGIAALNTVTGIPYSWNPTRTRGVGVQDMLATPQGLYVGSDTDRIGNYEYHARIAMLPLAGGDVLPPMVNATLPGTVYSVSPGGSQLSRRSFDGDSASSPASAPNGSAPWGSSVGAFMVNGVLYTATSSGVLTKRTFDGSTYGPASTVETADAEVFQSMWHNTDMPSITSLFYVDGQMYFTRSGQTTLFRRGFEPESDIVGQQRFTSNSVTGISYSTMRGAFVASGNLYFADTTGRLFRATWAGTAPVPGTARQISGPGMDAQTWNARALFVYQAAGQQTNSPPIPVADVRCTDLSCSYDSTDSSDPGGSIASVLWQFGDGVNSTSTERVTTHTYASSGPRTVTLTVTDNGGVSRSTTVNINPQTTVDSPPTANISTSSCALLSCSFGSTGSGDAQGPVTYLWDFGDTETSTQANPTHDYGTPGPRTVTLTVTDSAGQSATDTADVNPSDTASPVEWVGGNHTNGNRANHTVVVPSDVQPGDTMVLFFAANTTNPTYTFPTGWSTAATPLNGSGILGRALVRVAQAGDAGSTVRITSSAYAKSDMALGVYRGTGGVAAGAGALDNSTSASHTSPTVDAPAGSTWLVSYWADKSSGTTSWDAPATQTVRSSRFGSPSGAMGGLLADSAGDVSGSTGGLTATANSSTNRALSYSLVLD